MIEVARRSFITGLIALMAAPAIVRAGSLMPVKTIVWSKDELLALLDRRLDHCAEVLARNLRDAIYSDVQAGRVFNRNGVVGGLAGLVRIEGVDPSRCEGTLLPAWPHREWSVGVAIHG